MTINELTKEIHDNALAHGWWDEPRSFGEIIALCHSELSEALEEDRNGNPDVYYRCTYCGQNCEIVEAPVNCVHIPEGKNPFKAEGIAVEMADCIIRILDWAGRAGVDMEEIILAKHEYNKTRPYKHGKKY